MPEDADATFRRHHALHKSRNGVFHVGRHDNFIECLFWDWILRQIEFIYWFVTHLRSCCVVTGRVQLPLTRLFCFSYLMIRGTRDFFHRKDLELFSAPRLGLLPFLLHKIRNILA